MNSEEKLVIELYGSGFVSGDTVSGNLKLRTAATGGVVMVVLWVGTESARLKHPSDGEWYQEEWQLFKHVQRVCAHDRAAYAAADEERLFPVQFQLPFLDEAATVPWPSSLSPCMVSSDPRQPSSPSTVTPRAWAMATTFCVTSTL